MNEPSLLRLDSDAKLKLNQKDSVIPNSTLTISKMKIDTLTKSYVERLHEKS